MLELDGRIDDKVEPKSNQSLALAQDSGLFSNLDWFSEAPNVGRQIKPMDKIYWGIRISYYLVRRKKFGVKFPWINWKITTD